MAAPKGTRPPAAGMGRIKGSKNKLTKDMKNMVDRIIEINAELDKEGKGLLDCAKKDEKWFHSIFTRAIVPKDVNVQVDGDLRISWQNGS